MLEPRSIQLYFLLRAVKLPRLPVTREKEEFRFGNQEEEEIDGTREVKH